ncbi:YjdF family protein [Streptomyces sp. NPDC047085]|uniref:YjdF family protein n=1 Tax=Streptomyces sp. NPDC047085 TaxID=3155140 RepID=UPI0034046AB7
MPSTFTVYFDDPFWVGVLEIADEDGVRAARHVFGAEPTGPELMQFSLRAFDGLLARALACEPVDPDNAARQRRVVNPKRQARAVAREQRARPVSTMAQEAMARAVEQAKQENRRAAKRRRAEEAEQRREQARQKAKSRHRGR